MWFGLKWSSSYLIHDDLDLSSLKKYLKIKRAKTRWASQGKGNIMLNFFSTDHKYTTESS